MKVKLKYREYFSKVYVKGKPREEIYKEPGEIVTIDYEYGPDYWYVKDESNYVSIIRKDRVEVLMDDLTAVLMSMGNNNDRSQIIKAPFGYLGSKKDQLNYILPPRRSRAPLHAADRPGVRQLGRPRHLQRRP